MNTNGYFPFLINTLSTIVRWGFNMLIKSYTTSCGLPSSRHWRKVYFVSVIKISISFPTSFLIISHSVTFLLDYTRKIHSSTCIFHFLHLFKNFEKL